jgi:hypothetical protein
VAKHTPADEVYYAALAAEAEDQNRVEPPPARVWKGAAAAAHGREFMLESTGASTVEEALPLFIGRPKKGAERGPAPRVTARVTPEDRKALNELMARTGKTESELVREAVHSLLQSA